MRCLKYKSNCGNVYRFIIIFWYVTVAAEAATSWLKFSLAQFSGESGAYAPEKRPHVWHAQREHASSSVSVSIRAGLSLLLCVSYTFGQKTLSHISKASGLCRPESINAALKNRIPGFPCVPQSNSRTECPHLWHLWMLEGRTLDTSYIYALKLLFYFN